MMAGKYTSEIQNWESADKYLGTKKERPLPYCDYLRIKRITTMLVSDYPTETEEIVVTLHGNIIVVFNKDTETKFPYRGRYENSPTTKRHRSAFGGPWKV